MRVLLIDTDSVRAEDLVLALERDGCEVVSRPDFSTPESLVAAVTPDVIIIEQDSPTRDTLESMRRISESNPHPVVLFVDRSDRESMKKAIRAGVSAYVVNEVDRSRVRTILDVAMARFESHQAEISERRDLSQRLDQTEKTLKDRKQIERAKGILMKRLGVSEEEAFDRLRKGAMDRKMGLGELAERVLTSERTLGGDSHRTRKPKRS